MYVCEQIVCGRVPRATQYACEQIVCKSDLRGTLHACEQIMCGKQVDWAFFRRIDEWGVYVIFVGILDFMDLLYFVIHCLRTLDLAYLAIRRKGAKG